MGYTSVLSLVPCSSPTLKSAWNVFFLSTHSSPSLLSFYIHMSLIYTPLSGLFVPSSLMMVAAETLPLVLVSVLFLYMDLPSHTDLSQSSHLVNNHYMNINYSLICVCVYKFTCVHVIINQVNK